MDYRTHLLIAEDHVLMAEGLRKLLEGDFHFVEIVGNGRELLETVATSKPDVVLLDIGMPLLNGIEAARRIAKSSPNTKVVILTAHNEPEYVVEAFRAGACGYVLKRCAIAELVTAIRQVLNGYSYVTPLVAQHVVAAATDPAAKRNATGLTSRQREVLQLVAEGHTAKEIASLLNLSVKTAVFHKMSIMDKLGIRTTAQLTRYAIEHGIAASASGMEPLRMSVGAVESSHALKAETAAV